MSSLSLLGARTRVLYELSGLEIRIFRCFTDPCFLAPYQVVIVVGSPCLAAQSGGLRLEKKFNGELRELKVWKV